MDRRRERFPRASESARESGHSQRCLRVGEEVRRVLVTVLRDYIFEDQTFSGQSLTITEVQMSPDLHHAKVFFLPLGGASQAQALTALQNENRKIRYLLGQQLTLRHVPALDFRLDKAFDTFDSLTRSLRESS